MDDVFWIPLLIPIIAIVGGITYAIVKSITIGRIRELEVRERIAMIERGLIPTPESDPRGFERAMRRYERTMYDDGLRPRRSPERLRGAGITLIGVGFGLMLLIAMTDHDPRNAIGVGGFLVIMGLAFLINGMLSRPRDERYPGSMPPPIPPGTPPSPGQHPLPPPS